MEFRVSTSTLVEEVTQQTPALVTAIQNINNSFVPSATLEALDPTSIVDTLDKTINNYLDTPENNAESVAMSKSEAAVAEHTNRHSKYVEERGSLIQKVEEYGSYGNKVMRALRNKNLLATYFTGKQLFAIEPMGSTFEEAYEEQTEEEKQLCVDAYKDFAKLVENTENLAKLRLEYFDRSFGAQSIMVLSQQTESTLLPVELTSTLTSSTVIKLEVLAYSVNRYEMYTRYYLAPVGKLWLFFKEHVVRLKPATEDHILSIFSLGFQQMNRNPCKFTKGLKNMGFPEKLVKEIADTLPNKPRKYAVEFTKTHIAEHYRSLSKAQSIGSCMSKPSSYYNLNRKGEVGQDLHPVMCYEECDDIALGLLREIDSPKDYPYVSRFLVNMNTGKRVNAYGIESSKPLLESTGLKFGNLGDCQLKKIETREGNTLAPYIDGSVDTVSDNGDYLRVTGYGENPCHETGLLGGSNCTCAWCEEGCDSDYIIYVEDIGEVCEDCISEHFVYLGSRDAWYPTEDCDTDFRGDWHHNNDLIALFDMSQANEHEEDLVELHNGKYAIADYHNVALLHDGYYALFDREHIVELADGSGYALEEDTIVDEEGKVVLI